MQKNILEYLEASAERYPQKIYLANEKSGEEMTFSHTLSSAKAIGTRLLADGIRKSGVVIFMDKSPKTVTAFWGVIYAGCYYACLDSQMPRARIDSILEFLCPRAIICDRKNEAAARDLGIDRVYLYDEISEGEICLEVLADVRARQCDIDPIYVVFTSGSTGIPKGVVACHRSVIDYTESLVKAIGFSEETVFANQTPLYFDAPLKELMPAMKMGGTVYFPPKMYFSFPMKLIDFLNEKKINTVCWVVSAFTQISSLGALEKKIPEYLTTVAFGSAVFPRGEYDKWRRALPNATFYNLYGPTEATGMSCYWRADRELSEDEPIPIGRPFDNTEILLLDGEGKESSEGEIYIRGTSVTMGYFNAPEKTSEAFVRNPLRPEFAEIIYKTGDIGRYNDRGELVFISRADNQIKHMGHRIELGEIEAAAYKTEGVREVCCVYDKENKKIKLFYVGETEESAMLKILGEALPRYMLPSECTRISVMPRTDNGKLDRKSFLKK